MTKEEQAKKLEELRHQRKRDLEWLAKSPEGRRILAPFFHKARSKPFTGNSNSTMYNQGQIDFANALLDDLLVANISLYQQAEREALGLTP